MPLYRHVACNAPLSCKANGEREEPVGAWLDSDLIVDSNTSRLYSQWLNTVIYWLINHCTDWARTDVTSFSRQFDFHDVIYYNRRRNDVFTTT